MGSSAKRKGELGHLCGAECRILGLRRVSCGWWPGARLGAAGHCLACWCLSRLLPCFSHSFSDICTPEDLAPGPGPWVGASLQQAESSPAHGCLASSVAGTRAGSSAGMVLPQSVDRGPLVPSWGCGCPAGPSLVPPEKPRPSGTLTLLSDVVGQVVF